MPWYCCERLFLPCSPGASQAWTRHGCKEPLATLWLFGRQDPTVHSQCMHFTSPGYHVRCRRRSGSVSLSSLNIFRSSQRLAQPLAYLREVRRSLCFRSELNRWEEVRQAWSVLRKWTADKTIKVKIVPVSSDFARRGEKFPSWQVLTKESLLEWTSLVR